MKRLLLTLMLGLVALSSHAGNPYTASTRSKADNIPNITNTFAVIWLGFGSRVIIHAGAPIRYMDGNYSGLSYKEFYLQNLGPWVGKGVADTDISGLVLRDVGMFVCVALDDPINGYWTIQIDKNIPDP